MAEGRKSNQGEDAQMSRAAAQTGVPESGKRGVTSSAPCPKLQLGMPNVKWIGTPNNPDASCQPSQCEGKRPSKLFPEAQGEKTPSRRPDGWAGSGELMAREGTAIGYKPQALRSSYGGQEKPHRGPTGGGSPREGPEVTGGGAQ